MDRTIFIYANQAETSRKIAAECKEKLLHAGLRVTDQLTRDTDLIICIGGDGTFLELIHAYDFPQTPIIGINTGHLGFFQDLLPTQIDQFIEYYLHHLDHLQVVSTVECSIWAGHEIYKMTGINEMVVKGELGAIIHLNVFFGDAMIERFSGDGILVSTPLRQGIPCSSSSSSRVLVERKLLGVSQHSRTTSPPMGVVRDS